ncbi:unnamed protein product [Microthlaspi erraticum]|uniref:Thioredoxin domain-containing protein n=1 Tax=Microthlaspi erraticum TaxID=1685480 RepID=A0A6D2HJL7_9BRAS|nr:unnamed protein product [Microthlaspi erraticum]
MCLESDHLIKTYVSSSLPSNDDLLYPAKLNTVRNITESEWDSLVMMSDEVPVLVMFTSDHCKHCPMMNLILNKLDLTYSGRFKFYTIDFDKEPVIAKRYYVTELPTTYIFIGGSIEAEVIGFDPPKVMSLVNLYAKE